MSNKEMAREILKKGVLSMSKERLIQMSHYGLPGSVVLKTPDGVISALKYQRITFEDDANTIAFVDGDGLSQIFFNINTVIDIYGKESEDKPDYLHIFIRIGESEVIVSFRY